VLALNESHALIHRYVWSYWKNGPRTSGSSEKKSCVSFVIRNNSSTRGVMLRNSRIWTTDAGFAMGFQSIVAWEALPKAYAKRAVMDSDRYFHERLARGWPDRNVRPILPHAGQSAAAASDAPHWSTRQRPSRGGLVQNPHQLLTDFLTTRWDKCPPLNSGTRGTYTFGMIRSRGFVMETSGPLA
jgi:hypothetical protein